MNDCYESQTANNYRALMALRTQCPLVRQNRVINQVTRASREY